MPDLVYATTVTGVGDLVADFREQGVLVFFGESAPEELHEFSILHRPEVAKRAPQTGDLIKLSNEEFSVLAVGSVASDNLLNLGHLDLKANGLDNAELPGDVNVEIKELPLVQVGDRLEVYSA